MANKIQLRRGTFATLPALSAGEPAFCTDTKQLFIGDGTTNIDITAPDKEDHIINGGFDIWQRGTSQATSGYGSDDRWYNENVTSTKLHSRQSFAIGQTDVPNNPTYFSRTAVTSVAGGYCLKNQRIEDVTKLAGKTFTLSFWAKADAAKKLCVEFLQSFGTGGSATVSGLQPTTCNLTTTWKRFTVTVTFPSVSGKTIGANNYTGVLLWFDAHSGYNARTNSIGQQSGTFDIANVTLVEGKMAKEWQPENLATLMTKCQRYYESSFDGIVPGIVGSIPQYGAFSQGAGPLVTGTFQTIKRIVPVVNVYNPATYLVNTVRDGNNGTIYSISQYMSISKHDFAIGLNSVPVPTWFQYGYIADAEL